METKNAESKSGIRKEVESESVIHKSFFKTREQVFGEQTPNYDKKSTSANIKYNNSSTQRVKIEICGPRETARTVLPRA